MPHEAKPGQQELPPVQPGREQLEPVARCAGGHHALLPLPQYMFPGLVRRWQELVSSELAGMVQEEAVERYIQHDGIVISDYALQPHQVHFSRHVQRGFVGKCTYDLRGPDEKVTGNTELTVRQQILLLARLAFYCGIGYKTAMGMGQVRSICCGAALA